MLKYMVFETAMGWVGLLASDAGLLAVTLPVKSAEVARLALGSRVEGAVLSPGDFTGLAERLAAYYRGEEVEFTDRLDLSAATPFRRTVWEKARLIPYGQTRSYLWLARQIGKPQAARAVGQALGRNPLPVIVPCHRVIASDGSPGGFTGGLRLKRQLLRLEGLGGRFT
jgi:methylated-DNA-[protein]-cysteine S-methyltransferase